MGRKSLLSPAYIIIASAICLLLLMQVLVLAFSFARDSAGRSMAARMAMMAMTTSNSMRVKPRRADRWVMIMVGCFAWPGPPGERAQPLALRTGLIGSISGSSAGWSPGR